MNSPYYLLSLSDLSFLYPVYIVDLVYIFILHIHPGGPVSISIDDPEWNIASPTVLG